MWLHTWQDQLYLFPILWVQSSFGSFWLMCKQNDWMFRITWPYCSFYVHPMAIVAEIGKVTLYTIMDRRASSNTWCLLSVPCQNLVSWSLVQNWAVIAVGNPCTIVCLVTTVQATCVELCYLTWQQICPDNTAYLASNISLTLLLPFVSKSHIDLAVNCTRAEVKDWHSWWEMDSHPVCNLIAGLVIHLVCLP